MPAASAIQPMRINSPASGPAPAPREAWSAERSVELASREPSTGAGADLEAGEGPQPAAAPAHPSLAAEVCQGLAKVVGGTLCVLTTVGCTGGGMGAAVYGLVYGITYAASQDQDLANLYGFYFGGLAGAMGAVLGCCVSSDHLCGSKG